MNNQFFLFFFSHHSLWTGSGSAGLERRQQMKREEQMKPSRRKELEQEIKQTRQTQWIDLYSLDLPVQGQDFCSVKGLIIKFAMDFVQDYSHDWNDDDYRAVWELSYK